jgi:hypothetical protein
MRRAQPGAFRLFHSPLCFRPRSRDPDGGRGAPPALFKLSARRLGLPGSGCAGGSCRPGPCAARRRGGLRTTRLGFDLQIIKRKWQISGGSTESCSLRGYQSRPSDRIVILSSERPPRVANPDGIDRELPADPLETKTVAERLPLPPCMNHIRLQLRGPGKPVIELPEGLGRPGPHRSPGSPSPTSPRAVSTS